MDEDQVAELLKRYVEGLFPKSCPNCQRQYKTLHEYLLVTTPVGKPISYDAELGNRDPDKLFGSIASANCPCGSTLSISSEQMEHSQRLAILDWLFHETVEQGITATELLDRIRIKATQLVLEEGERK